MKTKLFLLVPAMLLACSGILCLRPLASVEVTTAHPGQTSSTAIPAWVSPPDLCRSPLAPEIGRRVAAHTVPAVAPVPTPAGDSTFKLPPSAEQLSLWKALSEARHAVDPLTEREKALPQNQGVEYFVRNPGQRLTARFLADGGVRLGSGQPGRSWQATLRLDTGITASAVTATTNRVEACHGGGLTEWFENRPEGIEHGFTVVGPQGDTGRLEISLALEGLRAEVDFDATGNLRFVGEDGTAILGYGGLKAWDAAGKALPAEMCATGDGFGILLAVDARGASYPVRIDPLVVSLERKLTAGDGAALDHFGESVALEGDTAVVGAIGEDTAAGEQVGCAYVFVRSGTVWTQQAKLTASDGTEMDRFGCAVALAGDTALIGAYLDGTETGWGGGR